MKTLLFQIILIASIFSCSKDEPRLIDATYNPDMSLSKFSKPSPLTNPYFLFQAGKTYVYEGQTQDGTERFEHFVSPLKKTVLGIECVVIDVKEWLNDTLLEHTYDWFAQDNEGNVWYMGEAVDNYDSKGNITDHHGAWEAGVSGAKAGIIMLANPQIGISYRQEYFFNEAEDRAEVIATNVTVTVPLGTFTNCVKTKDVTDLDPEVQEYKYYASGIGLIKEENIVDKNEVSLKEIR